MIRWRGPLQGIRNLVTSAGPVNAVAIALAAALLLSACASPVEGLWPPSKGSAARTISVSLDTWHAMIAFPMEQAAISDQLPAVDFEARPSTQHSALRTQHSFEEWGYAERAWYLEGQTGLTGIVRALFWPTEGVVEVGHYDRVWADRTPQPPSELFVFRVSEEGYGRLRKHLRSTIAGVEPVARIDRATFYRAVHSYHLLHTCHQYAAHALREAGLPISPSWAFNRISLAWQLRRAARIREEQPTDVPAGKLR
jgi:Protein of unknown function (DUF2459)